jgi:ankyrin repeat protein
VRVLASKGANPGIPNTRLRRPLHGAASEFVGVYSTTKILLDHSANPSDKDQASYTPLHFAAQNGNERLVRLLLDHSANWRATSLNGELAVALEEKNGHISVARLLRENRGSTKIQRGFEQLKISIKQQ